MGAIAVLIDGQRALCDIYKSKYLVVYTKEDQEYECTYQSEISLPTDHSLCNIRRFSQEILAELKEVECNIIVGKTVTGVAYWMFDKSGIVICEADELTPLLFEQIDQDFYVKANEPDESKEQATERNTTPKDPIPINAAGDFYFDFESLQKQHPEITSKKALLPFLCNELYVSLTIKCSHVMPWLEVFVEQQGLSMDAVRRSGSYTVILTHGLCRNNQPEN